MITGYGLLIAFVISIGILLVSIIKFKVNPFLALLITSIITGFMVRMPINEISTTISTGFGNTLGSIGIVIGLGIIFGNILSESRATESIAKGLLAKTGEKNSALAVTTAGFLISIPVFMDAAFVIMMPIIKYVSRVTKKSLMVFVCASSVDTRLELMLQKAMRNLMNGRTSFVIAHRLSTIRNADLILVMNNGSIIEQGNHDELMEKGGFYEKLYNSQFADKESE
ncbi:gluconate permease [Clostridioides difficile]|nr:gluconate permease [Clostridioides difficile]